MPQKLFKIFIGFVIVLLVASLVPVSNVQAAASTWFVRIDGSDTVCNGTADAAYNSGAAPNCAFGTVQHAIGVAAGGDTIMVGPGTFIEAGQIVINKSLTLTGVSINDTALQPAQNTGTTGDASAWILVQPGVTFNISKFAIQGGTKSVVTAIQSAGSGTISNNLFLNISATGNEGTGVVLLDNMTVNGNTFSGMGRAGIFASGSAVTNAVITNNVYTGRGAVSGVDYGIEVGGGAHATLTGNVVTSAADGVFVHTFDGAGTAATITSNALTRNFTGIAVGNSAADTSAVTASFNQISFNTHGITSLGSTIQATNNWWGCNPGPSNANCNPVDLKVTFDPWLVLTPGPDATALPLATLPITANLVMNSNHVDTHLQGTVPNGTGATFSAVSGTVNPTNGGSVAGVFTFNYTTPKAAAGTVFQACTAVDNQAQCVNVTILNATPVAVPDTYFSVKNVTLNVHSGSGVLANDTDANNDVLTAVLNSTTTHGTLTLNPNGGFTYTPQTGFVGTDSFTYHATDGTAVSNIATVTINVLDKALLYLPIIMH